MSEYEEMINILLHDNALTEIKIKGLVWNPHYRGASNDEILYHRDHIRENEIRIEHFKTLIRQEITKGLRDWLTLD